MIVAGAEEIGRGTTTVQLTSSQIEVLEVMQKQEVKLEMKLREREKPSQ